MARCDAELKIDCGPEDLSEPASHWSAVFSLTMGVFSLVTAEFLPASLLTPMADALQISEGQAGQAVTVTAGVALFSGLLAPSLTQRLDRRLILLVFSVLLIISDVVVAVAPNLTVLLIARVGLGVALGGFWALAAALAMRLVRDAHIPHALSMIFTGVPVATVAAAAFGSYLGGVLGWRNVFFIAAAVGAAALIIQAATLPSLAPERPTPLHMLFRVLVRPGIGAGVLAIMLVFCGHFVFFTYVRPFLETVSGAGIDRISATLLAFGLANLVGTLAAGGLLARSLRLTLLLMPGVMALLAILLVVFGGTSIGLDTLLISVWGVAFGAVPVAWSTWITQAVPDEAESAGGLMGSAVQLAIMLGAAIGGVLFDVKGIFAAFTAAAVILAAATLLIAGSVRTTAPVSEV